MKTSAVLAFSLCLGLAVSYVDAEISDDERNSAGVASTDSPALNEQLSNGERLYASNCAVCHQMNGKGLDGSFPPLADSDYIAEDPMNVVLAVINGLTGPIKVNEQDYNSVMPNLSYLSDSDVADVVTFVINSFGNEGGSVSAAQVSAARGGDVVAGPANHPGFGGNELAYQSAAPATAAQGGGGGGGNATARPVAVIHVSPEGVKVEPVVDVTKTALAFFTMLGSIFMIAGKMRRRARKLR